MPNFDDKDVDIPVVSTPGSGCEPDEAPLAFLSVKKLSKEESLSPGVIQMLIAREGELRKENKRLRGVEGNYNALCVDYATLKAKATTYGQVCVFIDLVLILAPLSLGLIGKVDELHSVPAIIINGGLLVLIIAAVVAKYVYMNIGNRKK